MLDRSDTEEKDMQVKALEIRDEGTFIPALAVDMNPSLGVFPERCEAQKYLLRRCGYPCDGRANIVLTRLDGNGKATNDPYEWGGRTWPVAHHYIIEHWEELHDGDVVDVSFILGETEKPKVSERLTAFAG
jgi:hypothetical protein